MPTIAIGVPEPSDDTLAREAGRNGYDVVARCRSAVELVTAILGTLPNLVAVSAAEGYLDANLLAQCDAAGVRIVAFAASERDRRRASALGLHEVIVGEPSWSALESLLERVDTPSTGPRGGGQVLAVWGPAGAPGRTTLAVNIAAQLASAGFSVVLADVDTHGAAVAPALGLLDEAPGFAAACRLAGADSLTQLELERIGQRYLSAHGSFWVLTGIGRASRWPELSAERVGTVVRECRSWADFTVLDTGSSLESDEEISSDLFAPRRNAATIAALRAADRVIAVGAADPVGLSRFLRAHVDLIETLETDRITVVMNKIRASAIGPGPGAQVAQTLQRFGGITAAVLVPYDQPALDAAVLRGKTLMDAARKSPANLAIGKFVSARLIPPSSESAQHWMRWRRLLPAPRLARPTGQHQRIAERRLT
ncbi:P-loop NTPase [Parafrigoribacterium mesophilum]|uniref:AAA family ATPase n=1 Tax=Parafrigoribacterium mesophilum TaxID=433646 RepID=UPI0031FBF993